MINRAGWVVAIALATVMAACGRQEALVSVRYATENRFPATGVSVQLDGPGIHARLSPSDLTPNSHGDVREFETAGSGELVVGVELRDGQTVVGQGQQRIQLRSDWRWELSVLIDSVNPLHGCFGCFSAAAFPVAPAYRRSPADSLWLVLGGNSISNPVVY